MNEAVTQAKKLVGAEKVRLVGYSGGGTVVTLIAARRRDVSCLVTVAAPLDTMAWTRALGVSPLTGSLNPADQAPRLVSVPQTHMRGSKDALVPAATQSGYLRQIPMARVIDLSQSNHDCCWADDWRALRAQTCLAEGS